MIGGGLPVGAYGGKSEIMELIAPAGPVYQAGTLSGNHLAVTAGIATLKILKQPGVYDELDKKSASLADGLQESASRAGVEISVNRVGSMLSAFFTGTKVTDYATACSSNTGHFSHYFKSMLENGIYIAPSQFEAAFVSTAHSENDIKQTIESAGNAFKALNVA